jgi:hypothetical protein
MPKTIKTDSNRLPNMLAGGKFKKLFILLLIVSCGWYCFDSYVFNVIHKVEAKQTLDNPLYVPIQKEEVIKEVVNTEIQVLSDYMQLRNSKLPSELADIIATNVVEVSSDIDLAIPLIVGIMEKESIFNPMATSSHRAKGLMQILRGETVTIDANKAYDIRYNLEIGCAILKGKLDITKGNLDKALSNYSGGATNYTENVMQAAGRYSLYRYKCKLANSDKNDIDADVIIASKDTL